MSEEVKPTLRNPLFELLGSGMESSLKVVFAQLEAAEKAGATQIDVDLSPIMGAFLDGLKAKTDEIGFGLLAVTLQELQLVALYRQHKANLLPGEKVVLAKAKAQNSAGLIGADGQPLTKDEPSIIVPK